ncbi:MAG TPA: DUF2232 domain-containing protein [Xanthobacteraceae bacterium]|nr:DUF2232 domain-containing protein [Xanthobacteraceae bacterium]
MIVFLLIALGAGATSALLVASVASGSVLSVPLFYLAPLPILAVGLGWSHIAALIAASTAAVGVGLMSDVSLLGAYAACVGAPAYMLTYLALMARTVPVPGGERLEWFPVGRLILAAAVAGALATLALVPLVASNVEAYQAALRGLLQAALEDQAGETSTDAARLAELLAVVIPPTAAVLTMVMQLANLWLAGRISRLSGRLARPWPDLASARLPRGAAFLLFVSLSTAYLADGLLGLAAEALGATLIMAFGLVGLAVIHAITRGGGGRALVLVTCWLACLVLGWPFLIAAMGGIADTFLDLRGRFGRRGDRPANDA